MAPGPALESLGVDPGADTKFMLLDLDLVMLAFSIAALSAAAGGAFCNGISGFIVFSIWW